MKKYYDPILREYRDTPMPLKFVRLGGKVNHVQALAICFFGIFILVGLIWAFAEQIDHFFSIWQIQAIFIMSLFTSLGVWRFVKKILN